MPRTLPFELPLDIDNDLYQCYQSEEDTASEDGISEYAVTHFDTAGTADGRPSDNQLHNPQDMPDAEGSDMEHRQNEQDLDSDEDL